MRRVPGRCNGEGGNGALFVPEAIVIARHYTKRVPAGPEARIEGLPAGTDILPGFIHSIQQVTKLDALRYGEAQRGIVNFNGMRAGGKRDCIRYRLTTLFAADRYNRNGWGPDVPHGVRRIDPS